MSLNSSKSKWTVIGIPYFWLIMMLLLPTLYLFQVAISEMQPGGGFYKIYREGGWFLKNNFDPIWQDIDIDAYVKFTCKQLDSWNNYSEKRVKARKPSILAEIKASEENDTVIKE